VAQATTDLLARASKEGFDWLRGHAGLYHLACRGWTDRYGWAREILNLDPEKHEQVVKEVVRASSADFAAPAQRPAFSALDSSRFERAFGIRLPEWGEALRVALTTTAEPGTAHGGGV
jgi:dTDP-4-dehydrorhamnose reductase